MIEREFFLLEIRIIFIKKSSSLGILEHSWKGVLRISSIVEISRNNFFFFLFLHSNGLLFYFYILSKFKDYVMNSK